MYDSVVSSENHLANWPVVSGSIRSATEWSAASGVPASNADWPVRSGVAKVVADWPAFSSEEVVIILKAFSIDPKIKSFVASIIY